MFTKSEALNRIKSNIVKFKGAGICSLNHGISLNRDSLNRDLSVLHFIILYNVSENLILQYEIHKYFQHYIFIIYYFFKSCDI